MSVGYKKNGYNAYQIGYSYDTPIVLEPQAQQCDLDLWHDPMLWDSIFISQRLYDALNQAGMADSWFLKPCDLD